MALHFLKRDLRRSWWLYSLWFLIYAAEAILTVSAPSKLTGFYATGMARALYFLPLVHVLLLAILVPQVVHEDPLVGSTAFWLTRPISRLALLFSKGAALALIAFIPFAINTMALSQFGLGPGELGAAAMTMLAYQCSFVLPIAAIAVLTPNFRWYSAVLAGIAVGMTVFGFLTPRGVGGYHLSDPYADFALVNSKGIVAEGLLIFGSGLIFVYQCLTRNYRRSLAIAVCLAGGYFLVAGYWPWNFQRDTPIKSEAAPFDPSKLTLEVMPCALNSNSINGFVKKSIDGVCDLSGVPSEFFVQVRLSNARLTLPNGTVVSTLNENPFHQFAGYSRQDLSAQSAALGGIPVYSYSLSGPSTSLATLEDKTLQNVKDSRAKIVDDFDFVAGRYAVVAELPIAKGQHFERQEVQTRIEEVLPRPDGVTLFLLESVVLRWPGVTLGTQARDPRYRGDPVYLLVNRSRREAMPINPNITQTEAGEFHLSRILYLDTIEIPFGGGGDPRIPVVDKNWLAGATFVCLERVPTYEFWKTAEVSLPKLGEPWVRSQTPAR